MMLSDQKTILIVDDDRLLRTVLCDVFVESGYRARCAEDGFLALREIRQEVPDIVVSDLNNAGHVRDSSYSSWPVVAFRPSG